jgi:hypothetical protein
VEHFAKHPHLLIHTIEKLDARRITCGDVVVAINAFSWMPVTTVLWQGDEELPSQENMIFDAAISNYLFTYNITVLCESIT